MHAPQSPQPAPSIMSYRAGLIHGTLELRRGGAHACGGRMGRSLAEKSKMIATPQSLPVIETCDGLRRLLPGRYPPAVLPRLRRHGGRGLGSTPTTTSRPGGRAPCRLPGPATQRRPLLRDPDVSGSTPRLSDAVTTNFAPSPARCSKSETTIAATPDDARASRERSPQRYRHEDCSHGPAS